MIPIVYLIRREKSWLMYRRHQVIFVLWHGLTYTFGTRYVNLLKQFGSVYS